MAAPQGVFLLFSLWKTWKNCKSLCFPFPVREEAALSQREVEPEVRASFLMPGGSWDMFIQSGIHTGVPYSWPGAFPGSSWALAAAATFQALLNAPMSAPPKNSHWDGGSGCKDGGQPWCPKAQGSWDGGARDKEWTQPCFEMGPRPRNAGKLQWLFPFNGLSLSLLQSDPSLKDSQLLWNLGMMRQFLLALFHKPAGEIPSRFGGMRNID